MQRIELHDTLPSVFAESSASKQLSEVWLKDTTFERGTAYVVIAESGTGKSSLCSYIYGYRTDYNGEIRFDGVDMRSLSVAQWCDIRKRHIAYLPQEMRIFPELTALENVLLKNSLTEHKSRKEIEEMFERLGIGEKLHQKAGLLSIGQQQRVAIVRTLCQPCEFFLLDEPVSHLDTANNGIAAQMISEEARKQGAGVIVTSVGNNLMIEGGKEVRL